MTALVYGAACFLLCAGIALLRVVPRAREEFRHLLTSLAELRAADLTDEEKEVRARRAAVATLLGTGQLLLRLAGASAATLVPVWLADAGGLVPADATARFAVRPDVLIATTLVVGAILLAARKTKPGQG